MDLMDRLWKVLDLDYGFQKQWIIGFSYKIKCIINNAFINCPLSTLSPGFQRKRQLKKQQIKSFSFVKKHEFLALTKHFPIIIVFRIFDSRELISFQLIYFFSFF
eukprot:TRINITY_DN0_c651_g1_i6.p1 TRINITY_DN0_c651_g1~~TRINITY_DN0_c651_g1_i6.p1  ORF type:complete len:105 (+),score=4.50 TRINITY_DN0_c651_g1_i6:176-490(+)